MCSELSAHSCKRNQAKKIIKEIKEKNKKGKKKKKVLPKKYPKALHPLGAAAPASGILLPTTFQDRSHAV